MGIKSKFLNFWNESVSKNFFLNLAKVFGLDEETKKYNPGKPKKFFCLKKIIVFIYWVLGFFCLCSIIKEIKCNSSIMGDYMVCPSFLRAEVIFEAISIIGFSNILLGWLYANLDKKILSISYSEILKRYSTNHYLFTAIHLIMSLLCLLFSSAGLSESALIAFVLVLNGFVYQWVVMYCLVLNSNVCEKFASYIWDKRIENDVDSEDKLFKSVCILSQTMPEKNSKHFNAHLKYFSKSLLIYAKGD